MNATETESITRVVVEATAGGFEAGTEAPWVNGSNESRYGYWGRTRADALLAMLCFEATGTKRLAEGVVRDCDRILAIARAAADELGTDELNPNAPTTLYEVTGEFTGGGELGRLRLRASALEQQLRTLGIDPED